MLKVHENNLNPQYPQEMVIEATIMKHVSTFCHVQLSSKSIFDIIRIIPKNQLIKRMINPSTPNI